MRVIGYIRTSTSEQANGTEAQRVRLEVEAMAQGWDLDMVEEHVSGKTLARRPVLKQAMFDLDAGLYQGLAVTKLDRLARSSLDFASVLDRASAKGWALICLDLSLDTSTPNGRFTAHVIAAVAQLERDLISQRTRDALSIVRARGVTLGRPSNVSESTIDSIVTMRTAGLSLRNIAEALDLSNVAPPSSREWTATTVRRIWLKYQQSLETA